MVRNPALSRCLLSAILVLSIAACTSADSRTLYEKKSQYNYIIVREEPSGIRTLAFEEEGATQSAIDVSNPQRLVISYTRAIMSGLAAVPQPKRILIVGLGGGSMPMFIRRLYPDIQIDVAELDPDVADVAKRFFGFREDARMKVHIGDGRKLIETTSNQYDIIFLDAYGSDNIPYALATREFLQAVRARLTPGGIAVGNVWSAHSNRLYHSMVRTYQDVFDELRIVHAPASGNQIFIASPRHANLTRERLAKLAADFQAGHNLDYDLAAIVESGYSSRIAVPASAKVLLDADAPKD